MKRATRWLFLSDPGWLYLIAGLAACAAGLLLPAQGDLHHLRQQLAELGDSERYSLERLNAHANFLDALDEGDPALLLRLASSQLNLIPENEEAILLSTASPIAVTDWIERTVHRPVTHIEPLSNTRLRELATGRHRLWLFGGGVMAVFVGLLMGPGLSRAPQSSQGDDNADADDAEDEAYIGQHLSAITDDETDDLDDDDDDDEEWDLHDDA